VATVGTLSLGGNLVVVRSFEAGPVLRLIAAERVSTTNLVPTLMWALLRHPDFGSTDVGSLHSVMLGGATIPPHLVRRVRELGVVPIVGYGLTEAACVSMTDAGDPVEDIVETCGRPLPGVEVRVRDPRTGRPCAPGERGELHTRGRHVLLEYFRDPDATAAAIDADGWFRTGDLGTVDERGVVRIGGRSKDMIIRGGENVYPREIEDRLIAEEGVHDAAVVGLPDDYYGEIVAAFVQRAPGSPGSAVTADGLRDTLRAELSGYKVPSRWFFVDRYPVTPSGKIQKFELRAAWERGEYAEEPLDG
jgi:acyl-CoA synthetase (AMP-forming)/AMP-acid ligase II